MLRQKELLPQDTDLVGGPSDPSCSRLCQRGGLRPSTLQQEKPAFGTGCVSTTPREVGPILDLSVCVDV